MWELVYNILTKVVLLSTIALGTVERIIDGKCNKKDKEALYSTIMKLSKLVMSLYTVFKIGYYKTREPYVCYAKNSADRCKVGGIGLITDHALVDFAFIPLMQGIVQISELIFRNGMGIKFVRCQKLYGMTHIGTKMYAGRRAVIQMSCTPREMYLFLTTESHVIPEGFHIIIHQRYVEIHFNKSIKKGESIVTINPPHINNKEPYSVTIPAVSISQNPVNVLS